MKKTTDLVKEILMEYPDARNSDMLLYYLVCCRRNIVSLGEPFGYALMNLEKLNLPPIESVTRFRRQIQKQYPELASTKKVKAMRDEREEIFREYSKGVY